MEAGAASSIKPSYTCPTRLILSPSTITITMKTITLTITWEDFESRFSKGGRCGL